MSSGRESSVLKMHADELGIDEALVGRLVEEQSPGWGRPAARRVRSAGTDNAMYRLGDDMVVRLRRLPGGARQVDTESSTPGPARCSARRPTSTTRPGPAAGGGRCASV